VSTAPWGWPSGPGNRTPVTAQHLHLGGPPVARAQDLLDERAYLALAQDLEVVPAGRVRQVEARAQRLVGQDHPAPMVHGHDPVVHGGQDGLGARPVAGDLGDALLELVGRAVDDASQLPELVGPVDAAARGEVALGEAPGGVHHLVERARQRRGQSRGEERGEDEGEGQGHGHRPLQLRPLLLDPAQRQRHARDADHLPLVADDDRGVEQVVPHGGAVAHRAARARGHGLLDLGPVAVVLHRAQGRAGQRGVGQHAPIRGDDGDPGADVAGRRVDEPVQLVRGTALRQRLLHHPRHQAGLGQERGPDMVQRAALQTGPHQRQHGQERGGAGGHGRDRDAPAQPEPHCGSSAMR
jgi:hypothetical protein